MPLSIKTEATSNTLNQYNMIVTKHMNSDVNSQSICIGNTLLNQLGNCKLLSTEMSFRNPVSKSQVDVNRTWQLITID